jgi:hypothetical protein
VTGLGLGEKVEVQAKIDVEDSGRPRLAVGADRRQGNGIVGGEVGARLGAYIAGVSFVRDLAPGP